jgi:hypothetical protein
MTEGEHSGESAQGDDSTGLEILRLRQDYVTRQLDERPMSHSIAVAYRQVIAARMRKKSELDCAN